MMNGCACVKKRVHFLSFLEEDCEKELAFLIVVCYNLAA